MKKVPFTALISLLILALVIPLFNIRLQSAGATGSKYKQSITNKEINLTKLCSNLENHASDEEIIEALFSLSIKQNSSLLIQLFDKTNDYHLQRVLLQQLKQNLLLHEGQKNYISWFLWQNAKYAAPLLAQESLVALVEAKEQNALSFLVQNIETNKLAAYPDGQFVQIPWYISKQICKQYPNSDFAKGIKAYEEISGTPFFDIDKKTERQYGDNQYNPSLEIEEWLKWIKKYPGHIASDSAAYRLGRCYEISGYYSQALNWYYQAVKAPNGAIQNDAKGRLIYVLDVKMDADQLNDALTSQKICPEVEPAAKYTLALKLIRSGKYQVGIAKLQKFAQEYEEKPVYNFTFDKSQNDKTDKWAFWSKVKEQQAKLTELSAYAQQLDNTELSAPLQYKIAALIYHDNLIFYNHFWQGQRIIYNWLGHINEIRNQPPVQTELQNSIKEQNNYYQALQKFLELKDKELPPDLKEKVIFSIALCYSHLESYGQEIDVLMSEEMQHKQVLDSLKNYLNNYPNGNYRTEAEKALTAYQSSKVKPK
ncbi:hypothetical protein RDV78_05450 [Bacillota bacterium LX-D]|nr:hypothetical protein [Bacillota bacterium LX-D]